MRECCSGTSACEPARSTLRVASSLLMPSSRSTHVATVPLRPIPNPQCMGHFCPLRSLSAILTTNVRKAGLSAALGALKSGMGKFSTPQGSAWSARASAYGGDLRKAVKPPKPGGPGDASPKRLARMPQETISRGGPYLRYPFFRSLTRIGERTHASGHIARDSAAAAPCLREREGGFASFFTPAPSGTDLPHLATPHAGTIVSLVQLSRARVW